MSFDSIKVVRETHIGGFGTLKSITNMLASPKLKEGSFLEQDEWNKKKAIYEHVEYL